MQTKRIYIIGNPTLPEDNYPYRILPELKLKFPDIEFIPFDPTEDLDELNEKKFVAIDTIVGIKKVSVFSSLDNFETPPRYTVHDFDLYTGLSLLKKLKRIEEFSIIGIPPIINDETLEDVKSYISSI